MLTEQAQVLDPTIFRTYDIRGIVGKTLTNESVYQIGKAFGSLVREKGEDQLLMACDGRLSSPLLAEILRDGILSSGCDVYDLGMAPTPMLYYATHIYGIPSGIMLTGSHNPPDYNGLKGVLHGVSLTEDEIKGLYQAIVAGRFFTGHGKYHQCNVAQLYLKEISNNIQLSRPLKIVIDAGNGVTGMLAPQVFRTLGCDVHELFCEVDGRFPNHHPDPSQAENLQDLIAAVQEKHADAGLAFDGDGDRLGMVTNDGTIIYSDRLLMFFAQAVLAENAGAKIIYDVKCTNNLSAYIRARGGEPIMWKTGHSLIKAKLVETRSLLGGEMSGHFFFRDRWYGFDDAIYAGARLLEMLAAHDENAEKLFAGIPTSINTPELKVSVADKDKFLLMQQLIARADFKDAKEVKTIDGLRVDFADGWGLVRPSNTSPYLIMRFEAVNDAILKNIQTMFREWIYSVRPDLVLPF